MLRPLLLLACLLAPALHAQTRPTVLVGAQHPGAITVPAGDWKIEYTNVYDDGTRPVLQLSSASTGITASLILFENYYKKPTATGCRKDATDGILQNQAAAITGREDSESKGTPPLALTSWTLHGNPATILQRNLFAFASDAELCYEIHVSKTEDGEPVEAELQHALNEFHLRPGYKPDANDYLVMATLLFAKTPALAAPYYQQALARTAPDAAHRTQRRILTDQLVMALGMSGDLKQSRAAAQRAIETDPDYPIYYYNLACADAEEGNAAQARVHLEQAFARRQNVIAGEHMPDPSKDGSLLKLKGDPGFWAYVETLRSS